MSNQQNDYKHYCSLQSQTSDILLKLERKIQKYLSPSYQNCQNIFDKAKTIKRDHQQAVQNNKQFFKNNQKYEFERQQQKSSINQFDQLMNRRKKCQAKLHKMLFDHRVQSDLKIDYSTRPQKQNSFRSDSNQFISPASLQMNRNSVNPSSISNPNFFLISKQLHQMQKKLQKIDKKVSKSKTKVKQQKKNRPSAVPKQINVARKTETKKINSLQVLPKNRYSNFSKETNLKEKSSKSSKNKLFLKSKHKSSLNVNSQISISKSHKNKIQNCEQKNQNCRVSNDQISLAVKLNQNIKNKEQKKVLNGSQLKKIGLSKFNQISKKVSIFNNAFKTIKKQEDSQKQIQGHNCKKNVQKSREKSQNRIQVKLVQCESQQIL